MRPYSGVAVSRSALCVLNRSAFFCILPMALRSLPGYKSQELRLQPGVAHNTRSAHQLTFDEFAQFFWRAGEWLRPLRNKPLANFRPVHAVVDGSIQAQWFKRKRLRLCTGGDE